MNIMNKCGRVRIKRFHLRLNDDDDPSLFVLSVVVDGGGGGDLDFSGNLPLNLDDFVDLDLVLDLDLDLDLDLKKSDDASQGIASDSSLHANFD
ncbi:hypothetical protein DERP_015164 [Dermatophagoides pteronyssinus]|uniref:Uncharacterized protein n=1 Tax=Dermatophagoides pteronyssinus TaxID=6956 RepID=A0ABQ8J1R3_DERPT|nr:hypothetical protein DERP_015164 [Dermatophagoides pteronyssinus]